MQKPNDGNPQVYYQLAKFHIPHVDVTYISCYGYQEEKTTAFKSGFWSSTYDPTIKIDISKSHQVTDQQTPSSGEAKATGYL